MRRSGRGHLAGRGWVLALGGILGVGTVIVVGGRPAAAQEFTVQSGAHADVWWERDGGDQEGHEVLVPLTLSLETSDWGVRARGAYGTAERDPGAGSPTASMSGFTDTALSGFYRFTVRGVELRVGLDLDLPSGKARLRTKELPAVQDEDLVALERFGEGFDINPTLTAYYNFGAVGLGLAMGYLRTGKFDPTRDTANDDLDPGDELTAVALLDFYLAESLRVIVRGAYTHFTEDERGGVEVLREGDELDFQVIADWRPEPWWITVTVRDIVRLKAERPNAAGRLDTEPHNSNGNDIRGGVTGGYILSDDWLVALAVDVRHVLANDYSSADALYDGGRTKVAVGPSVTWAPTRAFSVDAGVRYFILWANRSPTFLQDTTIHGIHADIRLTYRF